MSSVPPLDHELRGLQTETRILENGMRITLAENPAARGQQQWLLVVGAGSRHDPPEKPGLAHFVEHLVFQSAPPQMEGGTVAWMEERGVRFGHHQSAHTLPLNTVYQLDVDAEDDEIQAVLPALIAHWGQGATFETAPVEAERGILTSEIVQRGRGNDSDLLGKPWPGGTFDSIESITTEDIRSFYAAAHDPRTMHLVVLGPPEDRLMDALAQTLSTFRAPRSELGRPNGEPEIERMQFLALPDSVQTKPIPGFDFKLPLPVVVRSGKVDDESHAEALVLARVLGARAQPLNSGADLAGPSVVVFAIDVPKDEPARNLQDLLNELALAHPLSELELERSRNQLLLVWGDRPFSGTLATNATWTRELLQRLTATSAVGGQDPFEQDQALFLKVTALEVEAVQTLMNRAFAWDALSILAVQDPVPEAELQAVSASAPPPEIPPSLPIPEARSPAKLSTLPLDGAHGFRLPSGVDVLLRPEPSSKVVNLFFQYPMVGTANEVLAQSNSLLGDEYRAVLTGNQAGIMWNDQMEDTHVILAGRLLPEQMDATMRRLADAIETHPTAFRGWSSGHLVVSGPVTPEQLGPWLAHSVAALPQQAATPRAAFDGDWGFVSHARDHVNVRWTRTLRPSDLREEITQMARLLQVQAQAALRFERSIAYAPVVELAFNPTTIPSVTLTLDVAHPPDAGDEVRKILESLTVALRSDATPQEALDQARVRFAQPKEASAWVDSLLWRLRVDGDLTRAWNRPVAAPLTADRAQDLARHYLPPLRSP